MRFFHLTETLDAPAYWHGPVGETFDHEALVSTDDGSRWSRRGEPTIYLSGNLGTVLVELGRHVGGPDERVAPSETTGRVERVLWSASLRLERVIDLRSTEVRSLLRVPEGPSWVLDTRRAREIAAIVRSSGEVDALRVPSVGLADRADRWNIVVFADELERPLTRVLVRPRTVGAVCLERPA